MRKTRHELKCEELAKRLKPLSDAQIKYAWERMPKYTVARYRKLYCSECGAEVKDGICQGCGTRFGKGSFSMRAERGYAERRCYFGIETTMEGIQLHRHFIIKKIANVGHKPIMEWYECTRNWINEKGQLAVQSLPTRCCFIYYDLWDENGEMKTRQVHKDGLMIGRHNINDAICYRKKRKTDWFAKIAPGGKPHNMSWLEWKTTVIRDSFAEWIAKRGMTQMLDRCGIGELKSVERELKLADRHHYRITDISKWKDMVKMLKECGKDTLNAKWSRPENLEEGHEQARRLYAKEMKRRQLEEKKKHEKEYKEEKAAFIGMVLSGKRMTVRTIESVEEMIEEGKRMHHCVASYYDKTGSLILTARNEKGERLATLEWSIEKKEVLQCRGLQNQTPKRYKEIMKTMEANRKEIERRTRLWKKRKRSKEAAQM